MIQNTTRSEFRQAIITLCLLIAALAITFFPVLFEGKPLLPSDFIDTMTLPFSASYHPQQAYNSFITDGYLQFYPLKYFTKQAYEAGNFAFWNPLILNGYPQYLDGMWTYNFVLFLPFKIAFLLILLLPLLVAGIGFYALLREYDIRAGVARTFAMVYMLNALFITNLLAHFIPASFSFAPLVLLFLHKYLRTPRFKYIAASSTALALGFMAGNIQTIGFLSVLVICYTASQGKLRAIRSAILVLLFAFSLSMIMILPTLELFRETISGGAFFSTSLLRSYDLLQRIESALLSLTFFIPQLAGSFRGVTLDQIVGVYTQDFEGAIGFIPLFIAVWAGSSLWKRRPEIKPFVVLMIVGLAIPIATPLFRFVYHRFLVLFVFGACGAGAFGMDTMLSKPDLIHSLQKWIKTFSYYLAALTLLLAIFTVAHGFCFQIIERIARTYLLPKLQSSVFAEGNPEWVRSRFVEALDYWRLTRPEILIGLATTFIGLAVLNWKNKLSQNVFLAIIGGVTFIQLAYFAHSWFPASDIVNYPLYPETQETNTLHEQTRDSRVFVYRELDSNKQFVFMDNENIVYGIPEATGYESVIPRSLYMYSAVIHPSLREGILGSQFLGKFNIGTLVAQHALSDDSLTLIGQSGPIWIYKNKLATPRAFLASTSSILRNDTIICDHLLQNDEQWPTAMFTTDQNASVTKNIHSPLDTISNLEDQCNEILMDARSHDSSYLVLSDTYYPGWTATVDGNDAPILRCNYAMRAIKIPSGAHKVYFEFRPASFRIGTWASLCTILIMLIGFYYGRRRQT